MDWSEDEGTPRVKRKRAGSKASGDGSGKENGKGRYFHKACDRRPIRYWDAFNSWWRMYLDEHGVRPSGADIDHWWTENKDVAWASFVAEGFAIPTAAETRAHAKCLRSTDSIREYFREYRARKKGEKGSSPGKSGRSNQSSRGTSTGGGRARMPSGYPVQDGYLPEGAGMWMPPYGATPVEGLAFSLPPHVPLVKRARLEQRSSGDDAEGEEEVVGREDHSSGSGAGDQPQRCSSSSFEQLLLASTQCQTQPPSAQQPQVQLLPQQQAGAGAAGVGASGLPLLLPLPALLQGSLSGQLPGLMAGAAGSLLQPAAASALHQALQLVAGAAAAEAGKQAEDGGKAVEPAATLGESRQKGGDADQVPAHLLKWGNPQLLILGGFGLEQALAVYCTSLLLHQQSLLQEVLGKGGGSPAVVVPVAGVAEVPVGSS